MNGNDHIKSTLRHLKHQVTSDTVVEATLAFHCRIYWKQLFPFSIDCKCFHQHFPYWLIDNNFEKNESFVSTKTLSLQYARYCLLFKTTSFFQKNTAKNGHTDTQSSNSNHLSSIRQQLSLVLNNATPTMHTSECQYATRTIHLKQSLFRSRGFQKIGFL